MLTLKTSGRDFQVSFKFGQTEDVVRTTECKIFAEGELAVHCTAYCNPKDNFSRVEGRKHSFERAVNCLADPLFGEKDYSLMGTADSNKQLRAELWNAYFALPMKTR